MEKRHKLFGASYLLRYDPSSSSYSPSYILLVSTLLHNNMYIIHNKEGVKVIDDDNSRSYFVTIGTITKALEAKSKTYKNLVTQINVAKVSKKKNKKTTISNAQIVLNNLIFIYGIKIVIPLISNLTTLSRKALFSTIVFK